MSVKKFLASFLSAAMVCFQFSAFTPKAAAKPLTPGAVGAIASVGGFASGAVIFGVPLLLKVLTGKSDEPKNFDLEQFFSNKNISDIKKICIVGEKLFSGECASCDRIFKFLHFCKGDSHVALCYSGADGLKHLVEDYQKFQTNKSLESLGDSVELVFHQSCADYRCGKKSYYKNNSPCKENEAIKSGSVKWFFENGGFYCELYDFKSEDDNGKICYKIKFISNDGTESASLADGRIDCSDIRYEKRQDEYDVNLKVRIVGVHIIPEGDSWSYKYFFSNGLTYDVKWQERFKNRWHLKTEPNKEYPIPRGFYKTNGSVICTLDRV